MNLPTRKRKSTSLTRDRLEPDYSILLLLLDEPSVPITTRTPVTIRKTPSSLDTVSKMLSEDVKQLILLFWGHHGHDDRLRGRVRHRHRISNFHVCLYDVCRDRHC